MNMRKINHRLLICTIMIYPWLALAADMPKFDIKLGGQSNFTGGYVKQSYDATNGTTQHIHFENKFLLDVMPITTTDNGAQYGAHLRIRANQPDGIIDAVKAYLFAGGQFGRAEFGLNGGPNWIYGVKAPDGFGTGGVAGDWVFWLTNQTTFLAPGFGGGVEGQTTTHWATRVTYYTPRLFTQETPNSGLMLGVSYAPQNLSVGTGVNRTWTMARSAKSYCAATYNLPPSPLLGCGYKNVTEYGLRYDWTIYGILISGSAGYEHGETPRDINGVTYHPLSAYQAGLQLGYNGITIGASITSAGKSSYAADRGFFLDDQTAVAAGVTYKAGPLIVGFNYAYGQDAGDVTVPGKRTADLYSLGATLIVAPGLTTSLEYLRSVTHNEASFRTDPFGVDARGTPVSAGGVGFGSGNADLILLKTVVTF